MNVEKDGYSFLAIASMAALSMFVVLNGWKSFPADVGVDPENFVAHSMHIADATTISDYFSRLWFSTRDIGLRYLPLSAVYTILQPGSIQAAERIASLHIHVFAYIFSPAIMAYLFYVIEGRKSGSIALFITALTRIIGYGYLETPFGRWQDEVVMPVFLLSLAFAIRLLNEDPEARELRWAGVVGASVAITALLEPFVGLFTVPILTAAYLRKRKIREWLFTGLVGSICMIPVLFAPSQFKGRIDNQWAFIYYDVSPSPFRLFGAWITSAETLVALTVLVLLLIWILETGWNLNDGAVLLSVVVFQALFVIPLHIDMISQGTRPDRMFTPLIACTLVVSIHKEHGPQMLKETVAKIYNAVP